MYLGRRKKETPNCQNNQIKVLNRKIYIKSAILNSRNVFMMHSKSEDKEIMLKRLEVRRRPGYSVSVKEDFQNKKEQIIKIFKN